MIERTVTVPAPPERVWEAITDPAEMEAWLGGRLDWILEEGGPLRFLGDGGEDREGRVEEVEPRRRLRFLWWDRPADSTPPDGASEVQYVLEPVGDEGTLLTVREAVVPDAGAPGTGSGVPVARAAAAGSTVAGAIVAGALGWGPLDDLLLGLELTAHRPVAAVAGIG